MSFIFSVVLVLSFLTTFHKDLQYSAAMVFSVTLLCVTALIITGGI